MEKKIFCICRSLTSPKTNSISSFLEHSFAHAVSFPKAIMKAFVDVQTKLRKSKNYFKKILMAILPPQLVRSHTKFAN